MQFFIDKEGKLMVIETFRSKLLEMLIITLPKKTRKYYGF